MKKWHLFFLVIFSVPSFGQNKKAVDSLLQITESGVSDVAVVDALNQIAFEHVGSDSAGFNLYIQRSMSLADSIDYQRGLMDGLYVMVRSSLLAGNYDLSDSLLLQLSSMTSSSSYSKGVANVLYAKAWLSYYRGDYEQSIEFHKESLVIREELGNEIDIADCLRGLGIAYKLLGEFDEALSYLYRSMSVDKSIRNQTGVAVSLNHIGIINSLRGDYSSAMDSYFEALEIEKRVDDKSGLAYTYQNIGVIYDQQKDYDKALEYYGNSLKLRKEIGEKRGVGQIINYIGVVHHELGDFDQALVNYQEALRIKEELGDKRGVADGNLSIGELYADQGRHSEAIQFKETALSIFDDINSDWGKVDAVVSLGQSYALLGDLAKAEKYLQKGISLGKEAKLVGDVRDASLLLSQIKSDLGEYKSAYEALLLSQDMSDSISVEGLSNRVALLEAKFAFEQERDSIQFSNEREKLLLDQRIAEQRSIQIFGTVAVVVLIVVIGILYRYYQLKNDSNRRLSLLNERIQNRNESLSKLNDEKNSLIGIVAHDLQNPLAGIIGALGLLDREKLDPDQQKLTELISISSERMSKMIKDILTVEAIEKQIDSLNLKPYNLSEAVKDVYERFSKQSESKNIELRAEFDQNLLALIDDRYALQIIENLVSNAIKFSPPSSEVLIKLTSSSNHVRLAVIDQGPGLSDADKERLFKQFQRLSAKPTANESSTGLGLSIVKRLVEKMNGEIWCESQLGKGATFFISLEKAPAEEI